MWINDNSYNADGQLRAQDVFLWVVMRDSAK